jgi:acyl carrier protein
MSGYTVDEVKRLIVSCCEASRLAGRWTTDLPDDFDLHAEGVVDSLGFLTLITEIEMRLGCQIDFDGLDPEVLTRVGPLARYIAERAA